MYPPQILLATLVFLFLSPVANSANVEAALRKQLSEVENIDLVKNVTEILNWREAVTRSEHKKSPDGSDQKHSDPVMANQLPVGSSPATSQPSSPAAIRYMRDCEEIFQTGHTESGLYIIQPENTRKLVVQCYMDGCNGWTMIQHNTHDTEITWSETWTTYKYGFGNLEADHWLGTQYISLISQQKWYKVRISLVDADNNHRYAEYDSFVLRNEDSGYVLKLGTYEGNAGDSLSNSRLKNMHDNMKFSCKDKDNDRSTLENCANVHGGGWWYDSCFNAQLNRKGGIHWSTLCQENCKKSVIMLKPIHMYCNRV